MIKSHNEFSNDIEKSKSEAKRKLILHRVAENVNRWERKDYRELATLKKTSTDLKKILSDEIEKLNLIRERLSQK